MNSFTFIVASTTTAYILLSCLLNLLAPNWEEHPMSAGRWLNSWKMVNLIMTVALVASWLLYFVGLA